MESIAIVAPVIPVVVRRGSRTCCFSMMESGVAMEFVKSRNKSSSRCMSNYSLRIISAVAATITADIAAVILVVK